MSGPYGPNDPNGQWAQGQQPGQGNPDQTGGQYGAPQYGQQPPAQPWGQPGPGQPQQPGQPQWGQHPQQPGQPQWGQQPQPGQLGQPGPGQWGQQPQPGQPQWGQQPGQPQQWGPAPGQQQWGQPPSSGKSKLPLIIGGVVALLVIVGIALVLAFTVFGTDTLDQKAAEDGVERIVTDSYGAENVSGVTCPADQEVKKGNSFTCSLTVDGEKKQVTLTFTDDKGTYEVSRPS
ncbi:DUF4333 domain-containing protein [Rhodococcus jostii]|uniref:DUF4333 domain-containing protein n=1 Tax=Rhodococcus jostii TaxID=132919 RepID=A0A1H4U5J8_RHOJO|nr:DUF4333 domain-containing protein [Rhodococcus jostii]SEC64002.1 protein of unknown function [Rhodococcus jostii]